LFEEIFFPRTAERYRAAPLVEQRERYLVHLRETGARRSALRKCANAQLSLVRLLNLKEGGRVRLSQVEAVTAIWSQPKARRCDRSASPKARTRFISRGIQWLRFLGWLDELEHEHHPDHAEVAIFEKWLREERGLSTATIQDYGRATDHFFFWLAGKGVLLSAVGMTDIDDVIAAEHNRGAWNRRTIHDYAQHLRPFFLFAEPRGWCRLGTPFTRFGVYRLIERCAAGVPELADRTITPHVIRHTTACHLVLAGVDINTIRAWLGHVSISTTNIYAEIDLTLKANAVALCEVGQPRPARSWKEDKDLMAFLKSL
jgi:Phage integrase family